MDSKTMTVAELITALQAVEDQSLPVLIEGCDCINPAKAVDTAGLPGQVLIEAAL